MKRLSLPRLHLTTDGKTKTRLGDREVHAPRGGVRAREHLRPRNSVASHTGLLMTATSPCARCGEVQERGGSRTYAALEKRSASLSQSATGSIWGKSGPHSLGLTQSTTYGRQIADPKPLIEPLQDLAPDKFTQTFTTVGSSPTSPSSSRAWRAALPRWRGGLPVTDVPVLGGAVVRQIFEAGIELIWLTSCRVRKVNCVE